MFIFVFLNKFLILRTYKDYKNNKIFYFSSTSKSPKNLTKKSEINWVILIKNNYLDFFIIKNT
jgi:hypothetical protein